MKTSCLRCDAEFQCQPTAHPPRFCDPCEEILEAHATKHERAQINRAKSETKRMAMGRHVPE